MLILKRSDTSFRWRGVPLWIILTAALIFSKPLAFLRNVSAALSVMCAPSSVCCCMLGGIAAGDTADRLLPGSGPGCQLFLRVLADFMGTSGHRRGSMGPQSKHCHWVWCSDSSRVGHLSGTVTAAPSRHTLQQLQQDEQSQLVLFTQLDAHTHTHTHITKTSQCL